MQNNILNTINQKLKYFKTNYLLFTISLIFLIFSIILISLINNLNMDQIMIKFSNFKIIFLVLISTNISLSIISLLFTNFFVIKKIFVRKIIISRLISNFSIIFLIATNIVIPLYLLIISQKTLSLLYGYYTLVPMFFSEIFLSIFLLFIFIILKNNKKNSSKLNKNIIKINQDEFKSKFIDSKNNFEKTFALIEETMLENNIYNSFKAGITPKKSRKLKTTSYLLYFLLLFLICAILFVVNINLNSVFSILVHSVIIFLILYSSKISYDLYLVIFIRVSTKKKNIHTYLPDLLISFFKKYNINYFYKNKIEKNNFIIETDNHYIKIKEKNILIKMKNENSLDLSIVQNSLSSSYIFELIKSIEKYFLSSIWTKTEFNEITHSKFKQCIEFSSKGLSLLQIISSILYIGLLTTILDGGAYENK